MRELAPALRAWLAEGRAFAVASVVSTSGSAPRQPGAALAVSIDGEAIGSVSGGCVEGAVYELCLEVISTGQAVLRRFGYSDDEAFAVGLTCGGIIDVLVWPGADGLAGYVESLAADEPVALVRTLPDSEVTPYSPPDRGLTPASPPDLGFTPPASPDLGLTPASSSASPGATRPRLTVVWPARDSGGDPELVAEVRAMLEAGQTGVRDLCSRRVFVESHTPPPRMIVFGAIDFAAALTKVGRLLGYHVTVCDARPVFATPRRFPDAHEVVVEWPHRYLARTPVDTRTVIAVLTHDAKFDVPLLEVALRLDVAYVGAMGSRRTHDDRLDRLRAAGLTDGELAQLHSPIGLYLGARTPEETALSIAAEFVALRRGGTGLPLSATTGPIHSRLRPAV
ncbi:XdhC family protein [Nonomuraea soli]|uniref:Xanthine dehydrogenase accessory factor n=1 Tax=Nonomuraea soli TaxID=1032476 RepID=A0A7W0HN99_9ACTN|nr:XdhC/CoxI family protein [Nonomuraea soli]MBA2889567.1 xanthine dehydrogenase accessory factor [Nonomuraea soli]